MITTNITTITLAPDQEPCPSWIVDMVIAWLAEREVEISAVSLSAGPVRILESQEVTS